MARSFAIATLLLCLSRSVSLEVYERDQDGAVLTVTDENGHSRYFYDEGDFYEEEEPIVSGRMFPTHDEENYPVDDEFDKPHEHPAQELMEGLDDDDLPENAVLTVTDENGHSRYFYDEGDYYEEEEPVSGGMFPTNDEEYYPVDDEFDKPHENPTKELMEGFDNDDVQANVQMDHGARPSGLRRRLSAPMDDDVDASQPVANDANKVLYDDLLDDVLAMDDDAEIVSVEVKPTIIACHCDGMSCISKPKHMGQTISICLYSTALDFAGVSDVIMSSGDLTYRPIVDGVPNDVTEVTLRGRMAVVKTIAISIFYVGMDMTDLQIQGTASFAITRSGDKRLLEQTTPSDFSVIGDSRILKDFSVIGNSRTLKEDRNFFRTVFQSTAFIAVTVSLLFFVVFYFCWLPVCFPPEMGGYRRDRNNKADDKSTSSDDSEMKTPVTGRTLELEDDSFHSVEEFHSVEYYDSIFTAGEKVPTVLAPIAESNHE